MSPVQIAARWHLFRLVKQMAAKPIGAYVDEEMKTGAVLARYK